MDRDDVWNAIDAQRQSLTDLLERLPDEEWLRPSLCEGWTVRDVVGHLAWQQHFTLWGAPVALARARGNLDRMIHDASCRHALLPTERLIAQIRSLIGSRKPVLGTTYRETLIDTLVHGQDITVPLGLRLDMPPKAAAVAANRVWSMGYPFRARKRLAGYRITATDTAWSVGAGPEIRGPIDALLLLLTGRSAVLPRLSGDGTERLAAAARPL